MALDHLLEVLRQGAEAEVAAIIAAARTEAEAIRARSAAELAQRRGALLAAREAERHSAVEQVMSTSRRAARRDELEARQRLLDRIFAAATARFPAALGAAQYRAGLPRLVAEAIGCLGERKGTLRCHPVLGRELGRLVGTHPSVRVVTDPGAGSGFRLASDDGAMEIDATLEDRLLRRTTRIAVEVVARLEAGP